MTKLTLKQAAQKFMNDFNHVPEGIIKKAYPNWFEELTFHVTELECSNCGSAEYTAEGAEEEGGDDILTCMNCGSNDIYNKTDLPMWGTLFNPKETADSNWILENLDTMQNLGIWVLEDEEFGVLLGIDGAGYDFYESHWIPLYKARGFKWHDEEYEFLCNMMYVGGYSASNKDHEEIALDIFKNVQPMDEKGYSDLDSEGMNYMSDKNLYSLISDLLHNDFTMEQIRERRSELNFYYCKEVDQHVLIIG